MQVIPAINCVNAGCAKSTIAAVQKFLPKRGGWVHLDVADAKFTFNKTWGSPTEWAGMRVPINTEVHLMVEYPERVVRDWCLAGARRVIVHIEALARDHADRPRDFENMVEEIVKVCRKYKVDAMLSAAPKTPVAELLAFKKKFKLFQILAVEPGIAGQKFIPSCLHKIKSLRDGAPNAKIEVDGGVDAAVARRAKEAGADMVVSASFILKSPHPKLAFQKLKEI